jgi:predicted esterase
MLAPIAAAGAQDPVDLAALAARCTAGAFEVGERTYPYRLLEPPTDLRDVPRPLVVFLHGAGERGDDNVQQLRWLPERFADEARMARWPCFVLAVQCPTDEKWVDAPWHERQPAAMAATPTRALQAVQRALDEVLQRPGIDPACVHATGLSMGGFGAIELAARAPERFASLLAICGGGDPQQLPHLVGLPIALWHGADDAVVPAARSRDLAAAMRTLGAPVVHRELPGVGHDAWRQAYADDGALPWLFAQDQRQQRRGAFALPAVVPALDGVQTSGGWFQLEPGSRCFAGEPLANAARLFVDGLEAPALLRPGLAPSGEAKAGDVEFVLVPALATPFVVTVTDRVRIEGRDAAAAVRAAAVAAQWLRTAPGHRAPCGRIAPPTLPPGGRVTFDAASAPWRLGEALAAVRQAWWFGAEELVFGGVEPPPGLSATDWAGVQELAARAGVALLANDAPPPAAAFEVNGDDVGAVLLRGNAEARRFHLRLPAVPAAAALVRLAWLLPASAERAARREPLHVGGFWSRLGALRR